MSSACLLDETGTTCDRRKKIWAAAPKALWTFFSENDRQGPTRSHGRAPLLLSWQPTSMSIRSQLELEKLRAIGKIVRLALDRTAAAVRPGITTAELDGIGERVLADHGAESAPPKVYQFPGALCISVNEEAIHGI